jgi:hypothetical protein
MHVFRASDGAAFQLDKELAEYDRFVIPLLETSEANELATSIPQLITSLEAFIEIKRENILLFLEDGRELKLERLQEAWTGEGPSTVSCLIMMMS